MDFGVTNLGRLKHFGHIQVYNNYHISTILTGGKNLLNRLEKKYANIG